MRKLPSLLLFLFVLFLVSPTVVCVIENDADISVVSTFSEEEQVQKDMNLVFSFEQISDTLYFPLVISKLVHSENTINDKDISLGIFIPPPELG